MSLADRDAIYSLLPSIHRIRDAEAGGALQALFEVMAKAAAQVEADIAQRHDDAFIETCADWVVPYIADLLGVHGMHPVSDATFSARAWVANTLGYRRRKGTATILEQLARDTTGWPARATEFFTLLAATQHLNHVRLDRPGSADLRRASPLELVDSPFDRAPHSVDVRHIANARGRHNIPNVGLYLWRLQDYPVDGASASAVADPVDGRYLFAPFDSGVTAPLFNSPQSEEKIEHLADEINVPGLLRRRVLFDALAARRAAWVASEPPTAAWFGDTPVLRVALRLTATGPFIALQPEELAICNLSDWHRPETTSHALAGGGSYFIQAAVDPQTGRIAFPAIAPGDPAVDDDPLDPATGRLKAPLNRIPVEVRVHYSYGFAGDLGGGPYDRGASIDPVFHGAGVWQAGVSRSLAAIGTEPLFTTLQAAVRAWNALPAGRTGVIVVMDDLRYGAEDDVSEPVPHIVLQAASRLLIVAANWPLSDIPNSGGIEERRAGNFSSQNRRGHFRGVVEVSGNAPAVATDPGGLVLNGLLIEGALTVKANVLDAQGGTVEGNLGLFTLQHSTLNPAHAALTVEGHNDRLRLTIDHSICGAIASGDASALLAIDTSIVDAKGAVAVAVNAPAAAVRIDRCTVFGTVAVKTLNASETLFIDPVVVARRQTGCVRFSYLAEGSQTPRRFRCQPDLALAQVPPAAAGATAVRVRPQFTADRYGEPAYTQLARGCAAEITEGGEDGAEIGVWNFLKQPQRVANLATSLDEYLRAGLEAGMLFVT